MVCIGNRLAPLEPQPLFVGIAGPPVPPVRAKNRLPRTRLLAIVVK